MKFLRVIAVMTFCSACFGIGVGRSSGVTAGAVAASFVFATSAIIFAPLYCVVQYFAPVVRRNLGAENDQ
jgi:hypothetical protein